MTEPRHAHRLVDLIVDGVVVLLAIALPLALAQTPVGQMLIRLLEQPVYYGPRGLI